MEELTLDQQKALAMARARMRAAQAEQEETEQEPSFASRLARQVGLTPRHAITGVSMLPAMMADAATGVINQFLPQGQRFGPSMNALNRILTKAGLPEPASASERVVGDAASAMAGTGGAAKLAGMAGGALSPLSERVGTQILSAGLGSSAGGIARENEVGPAGQILASLLGAALPMAAQTVGTGLRGNFTQAGRDTSKGRLLNKAAGEQRPQVLEGLGKAREFVPGERPTAIQAASEAGAPTFTAVGKEVAQKYRPDLQLARDTENEAARLAAVRTVGKDTAALEASKTARAIAGEKEYGAAFAARIKADPTLAKLFQDPFIKKEVPDALELMKGRKPTENLTEFLQYVKIGIDQKLSKTGNDALSSAQQRAAQDAKDQLLVWIAKKNPKFELARAQFAKRSEPINQMQIGQYLENKLTAPLTGDERAGTFATALRDAPGTIRRAAGGPRYENLSDVLTQPQVGLLGGVKSSLAREAAVADQARRGGESARGLLGAEFSPVEPPPFLHRAVTAARFALEKIGISTRNKTLAELAKDIQEPSTAARLMREATPTQRAAMWEVIKASSKPSLFGAVQPLLQVE